MSTIVTRAGKGNSLTNAELDANFTNLNTDKSEKSANLSDLANAATALTNLGIPASIQNSEYLSLGMVAGTNTITAVATPSIAAYVGGQTFRFMSVGANTGPVTLNIDGKGAKAITKAGTAGVVALVAGDIPAAGIIVQITYDGTQFQLISGAGASRYSESVAYATAKQVLFNTGITYVPGNKTLICFLNGMRLASGVGYSETSSTSITLARPAEEGDELLFVSANDVNTSAIIADALSTSFTQFGTGSTPRNAALKLYESVSVADKGADTTGIADATAAFNAASASTSGFVTVTPGNYKLTGTVTGKFFIMPGVTITGGTLAGFVTGAAFQITDATAIYANSSNPALRVTQAGSGPALLVEDQSGDTTPFLVASDGRVMNGYAVHPTGITPPQVGINSNAGGAYALTSFGYSGAAPIYSTVTTSGSNFGDNTLVSNGQSLGRYRFYGTDGTAPVVAAQIEAFVDGVPGTNDMPGRLVFSTTPDGSAAPLERMRIDSAGCVGIGAAPTPGRNLELTKPVTGHIIGINFRAAGQAQSDVTDYRGISTSLSTAAVSFTLPTMVHYAAIQGTIGAGSTVTGQFGFKADSTLTGATGNYGFYGDLPAGTGRYNFYANGAAPNYFAGDMQFGKTVTASGTTGAQTINKTIGSVNFSAGATSLVVTNALVTANSIITATVGTNDATMKSVAVVAGAGSFTIYANAAPTAETRVNFHVFN